ncbi:MAG: beta-ketoacyl-[acyl-carrier-protein] synthase family protein [Bacteroidales bacterium]|nr:beta-ketoacyl-[acyl-carrier-protein] synthase family protein [Bacteroidales bacterium]
MRVVVTGIGIISSIGFSVEETLESLLRQHSGVGPLEILKTVHNDIPCAEIKLDDAGFRKRLGISDSDIITRTSMMGICAVKEALEKASLQTLLSDTNKNHRIGLISGTTVGGMEKSEQYYSDFTSNDNHKEYIEAHDCGACTEKIADYFGCFSYLATTSTACSSAANSLSLGADLIKNGSLEVAVAGGSECLTKFHLNGFNSLMILDSKPCRPFDDTRAGLNLGEGAAYIVLESLEHAQARGANIYCELSGYANACDAFHQTASSPEGIGATISMKKAIEAAGLLPSDIDYVNAHGTGTSNNDLSESNAMLTVFDGKIPPFSSTKPYTGHTTSASGSIEVVISILSMQNNFIPPNLNFGIPMKEVNAIPVSTVVKNVELRHILTNSFGFGGNNTSLVLSKL